MPDISKWNTEKVTDFSKMFNECKSLLSLPDISKWNTSRCNNMMFMFSECKLLSKLPDLSKWDTSKVDNIRFMFNKCESLAYLPDISISNYSNSYKYINKCISLSFENSVRIKISGHCMFKRFNLNCINCTNI